MSKKFYVIAYWLCLLSVADVRDLVAYQCIVCDKSTRPTYVSVTDYKRLLFHTRFIEKGRLACLHWDLVYSP